MNPEVSITICTYNDEKYISGCITSLISQTFKNFELIIVNDASTDNTEKIIKSFKDKRIKYFKNNKNIGISSSRNRAIGKAKGKYIFITDGDCHPKSDWIEKGITHLKKNNHLAIEGKLVYNKEGYKPTLEDRNAENLKGGLWMTANMAYKREVFNKIKFDSRYDGNEDRALALDINKINKIPFIKEMVVYHYKKTRNIKVLLNETKRMASRLRVYKDKESYKPILIYPKYLLVLFFPPIILLEFVFGRVKSFNDLKLLPFIWVKAVYLRYIVWKTALEEGVLFI